MPAADAVRFKIYTGPVIRVAIFDDPEAAQGAAKAIATDEGADAAAEATVIVNPWPINDENEGDEPAFHNVLKALAGKAPTAVIKVTPKDPGQTDAVIDTLEDRLRDATGRRIRLVKAA
jgi:hypothetical protein